MVEFVTENWVTLVGILAGIHGIAVLVVNLTPTPARYAGVLGVAYASIEVMAGMFTAKAKQPAPDVVAAEQPKAE